MSAAVNVLPQQRPSLLDRRASNNMPDLPDHLSVADLFSHTSRPSPSSSALRQSHNPRRPTAGPLPFVPLTPIMASPLLTPDVVHAPTPAAVLESAARQRAPAHAHLEDDYITHHTSPPNPVWTTSPPTPPPKSSPPTRLVPSTPLPQARAMRHRSKTRSWTAHPYRAGARPASVAYFTPSALSFSSSPAAASTAPSNVPAQTERVPVRRLSLPTLLSKPLPRVPGPSPDGAPKPLPPVPVRCENAPIDTDMEQTLLPSLTRRAPTSANVQASTGPQAGETGTLRVVGKKLFELAMDEGDQSDEEEPEQRAYKEQSRPTRERSDLEPDMGQTRVREHEKEKAERLRRYHALMELLNTEVGYLLDLRALVTVYLDQLVVLASTPTTPTPTGSSILSVSPLGPPICIGVVPPRPMSSFSALFPNSRSPPSASESPTGTSQDGSGSQDRDRQPSGSSDAATRDREPDKENLDRILPPKTGKTRTSGSVLIEREVRAVCRNAQELLHFHERFVGELRDAVTVAGFRGVLAQTGEGHRGSEESVIERLERAVEVVAAKFVNEAASFDIYETFCPGHAAATDLVRRAQERWPAAWDAYEQRCAQLVCQATLDRGDDGKDDPDLETSSPASPASEAEDASEEQSTPSRRHRDSLSFVFPAPPSSFSSPRNQLPFPANGSSATSSPSPGEKGTPRSKSKLKFMDYLIKPVQRICKYPLLLDQLLDKRRKRSPSQADLVDEHPVEAVRRAGELMREVVGRVNRASEKEAHNLRSALIASRIAFSHALPNAASSALPLSSAVTSAVAASTSSSSEGALSSSHGHSNSISSCSGVSTAPTSPGTAYISSVVPPPRPSVLTADFVSSLGPCMLAGALDVVHYPSHRAKYLGAFLYAGGYCILAKITKGGRVYEPRHWFSFSEVEVVDTEEDDAAFPFSFRISGYGHLLELAASCTLEKSIWFTVINDSLSVKSSWKSEPLSSFQADDKTPPSAPMVEEPQEFPNGLPAIQPPLDLEKQPQPDGKDSSANSTASKLRYTKTLSRLDSLGHKHDPHSQPSTFSAALSRRSSTASVKAFFSPMSLDSTRIQRVSAQFRSQIDHGLHDIFSESCLAARAQAQMRGDELFQVRSPGSAGGRRQGSGVSRSNSGLSLASAMGFSAAKRKYDMVSRRNRSVDLDISTMPPLPPLPAPGEFGGSAGDTAASGLSMRAKSLASRRHKKQPPSIAPAISTAIAQMNTERGGQTNVRSSAALSLDSPPDASHCSSVSSVLHSPLDNLPLPIPVPGVSPSGTLRQSDVSPTRGPDSQPKRARSMVDNVRSFFQPPRADSPTPTASSSSDPDRASPIPIPIPTLSLSADGQPPEHSNTIVQWLRRTSLRRRPGPSSYPSSASVSTDDSSLSDGRRPLPMRNSTDGVAPRSAEFEFLSPHSAPAPTPRPRKTGLDAGVGPKRHRSLFVPSTRAREFGFLPDASHSHSRESTRGEEVGPPVVIAPTRSLSARKSLKNVLLFNRSSAMTPITSPHTSS